MVNNTNKTNNNLSPQISEDKKDHNIITIASLAADILELLYWYCLGCFFLFNDKVVMTEMVILLLLVIEWRKDVHGIHVKIWKESECWQLTQEVSSEC